MKIHIFSAVPEAARSPLTTGIIGRAVEEGRLELNLHDLHELSPDPHRKVDDTPYGGGPGMLFRVDVIAHALEKVFGVDATVVKEDHPVILLTPQGRRFTQDAARELAAEETLVFICGRYEGFDERIREHLISLELSLGDFVLSGGEVAAAAMIDAVARLLPGVLGNVESIGQESFAAGQLEYPQYTRPATYRGWTVPAVLSSGNHAEVERWREERSLERTRERRPDLLD